MGGGLLPDPASPRGDGKVVKPQMDGCGLSPRIKWREESGPSQSLLQQPIPGGGLGKTPVLWDGVRCEQYPNETDDRPRVLWSSPKVRSEIFTPDSKILSYRMNPELSCLDPFNLVNPEVDENKVKVAEQFKSPPSLIPTKMKESSPILEEPNHIQ